MARDTEVSCLVKYLVFGFNVIFWLAGGFILGIGLWAWFEKGTFDNITKVANVPVDPVLIFVVVGAIMFILGFSGCVGALRENIILLRFFSVVLGIIFFVELAVGVLGFVYKDWFKQQLDNFIQANIIHYRDDPDLQNIIDFVQSYFQCCGGKDFNDWENNIYFNCTLKARGSREACGVPFSCCKDQGENNVLNTQCGYDVREEETNPSARAIAIYTKGCVPQFEAWLQDNLFVVAGVAIGIALLQILGICFANSLISDIVAQKSRWQFRR
ncbi:tetraspanin-5-like isoform X1 [Branchiostoma lanceolatum]|uniref:Tetraspanin n=1 Tax=Branchiostoma lanceolatum TaxID=7740 RepID=A0A8J9Z419_BRALA|nr:TSPAN5 [Branchiostoma lanceolatum]